MYVQMFFLPSVLRDRSLSSTLYPALGHRETGKQAGFATHSFPLLLALALSFLPAL